MESQFENSKVTALSFRCIYFIKIFLYYSYLVLEVNKKYATQLAEKHDTQIITLISEQRLLFADTSLTST